MKTLIAGLSLAVALGSACARELEGVGLSVEGSVIAGSMVALWPISVAGGSYTVGKLSWDALARALAEHAKWTVGEMTAQGDRVVLTLRSADQKESLTVSAPASQVALVNLATGQTVTVERPGKHSFALKAPGGTLGVLSDPAARLSHSQVKR